MSKEPSPSHFVSSVLSAAANVARQLQNVQRDLRKKMQGESRAVGLALERHNLVYF